MTAEQLIYRETVGGSQRLPSHAPFLLLRGVGKGQRVGDY